MTLDTREPDRLWTRQLGHANAQMVLKVYGRYRPTFDELDRLERLATVRDRQQFKDSAPVGAFGVPTRRRLTMGAA